MSDVFDFLWWWWVDPSDDLPHLAFQVVVVLVVISLALAPLFLEGMFDPHVQRGRWRQPKPPYAILAASLAVGGLVGAASGLLVHHPLIAPSGLRYASLLVGPLIVGAIASTVAYWRGTAKAPRPRFVFANGVLLALGVIAMRIALR